MRSMQENVEVMIVGGGLTGVTVARSINEARQDSWKLVEKSRSVGGRMATRRIEDVRFDHGAQFFTARSEAFRTEVDHWLKAGICKVWVTGGGDHPDDADPRYMGAHGMNHIVKSLAESLPQKNIGKNEKILDVTLADDKVVLTSESGAEFFSNTLVLTLPLTQTTAIMSKFPADPSLAKIIERLSGVVYDPCVAVMGFFDADELPLGSFPAKSMSAPLAFVADNFSKGLSGRKASLTVHLSSEASHGLIAADDRVVIDFVCHEMRRHFHLNKVTRPVVAEVHRWRFASPKTAIGEPFLAWRGSGGLKIYFAGEAFGAANVESAYLSGLAVGRALTDEGSEGSV